MLLTIILIRMLHGQIDESAFVLNINGVEFIITQHRNDAFANAGFDFFDIFQP
jgi:hypothetical protein